MYYAGRISQQREPDCSVPKGLAQAGWMMGMKQNLDGTPTKEALQCPWPLLSLPCGLTIN